MENLEASLAPIVDPFVHSSHKHIRKPFPLTRKSISSCFWQPLCTRLLAKTIFFIGDIKIHEIFECLKNALNEQKDPSLTPHSAGFYKP